MMAKHGSLYKDSPKLERNEDGDMKVGKKKTVGDDGSSAEDDGEVKNDPHEAERNSMYKRHEEEQAGMHERHKKDMKEMHKRHNEAGKTGSDVINKVIDSKE